MKSIHSKFCLPLFVTLALIVSCSDNDEPAVIEMEDDSQVAITEVTLTFTPDGEGETVTATWLNPGISSAPVMDDIELVEGVSYELSFIVINTGPSTPEDFTAEILEEGINYQFIFGYTDGIFADPAGFGNIDYMEGRINYRDTDEFRRPIGLTTIWTAGEITANPRIFNVVLKYLPDTGKFNATNVNFGEALIDITFNLSIVE